MRFILFHKWKLKFPLKKITLLAKREEALFPSFPVRYYTFGLRKTFSEKPSREQALIQLRSASFHLAIIQSICIRLPFKLKPQRTIKSPRQNSTNSSISERSFCKIHLIASFNIIFFKVKNERKWNLLSYVFIFFRPVWYCCLNLIFN